MAKIEVRTTYLFADTLPSGKIYDVTYMQTTEKLQKGKKVPYIILMGDIGEGLTEYELCVWNIQSKTIQDTDLLKPNQALRILRKGRYINVEVV